MEPDRALQEIRDLALRISADLYTANDQALADGMDLAKRVRRLDRWLAGGGLFPAQWEDTHPWVKVRGERDQERRRAQDAEELLQSARRAVDQLEGRRGTVLELLAQGPAEGRTSEFLDKLASILRGPQS